MIYLPILSKKKNQTKPKTKTSDMKCITKHHNLYE